MLFTNIVQNILKLQEIMKKNTEISERIAKLIEYTDVSSNEFAKKLGYKRSQTIYDILNGKSAPSYDFFNRLLNTEYSETINLKWLITGSGYMLNDSKNSDYLSNISEPNTEYNTKIKDSSLVLIIEQKDKDLRNCYEEIGRLKEIVRRLQKNHPHIRDVPEQK